MVTTMLDNNSKKYPCAVGDGHFHPSSFATIVFFSIFFTISHTTQACNTYYVSTTGSDSNPGSIDQPWLTIQKAAATSLKPCDTVYVRGGVYTDYNLIFPSGTKRQPITISAYPGESPVLDGTGLNIDQWTAFFNLLGSYIQVSGFELRNGGVGVYLHGPHNTVSNMNIHGVLQNGILAKGDYSVVKNNTVSYASQSFRQNLTSYGSSGISSARDPVDGITDSAILEGNTVFAVWGEGLSAYEANGTIIDGNTIYDNLASNTYISDASNVIFRDNLVYTTSLSNSLFGNPAPLLSLADELTSKPRSSNNVIINNMFLNGNVSAFSWTLVSGSGLTSAVIANNTLVNGQLATGPINTASFIENNIVYRNDGEVLGNPAPSTGITFSHNLWSPSPPWNASGNGDIIADPKLSLAGAVESGQVTQNYFLISSNSPAISKGIAINAVTDNYLVTNNGPINIGAYITKPPFKYIKNSN